MSHTPEIVVMCDGPEDCEYGFRGVYEGLRADRFGAALDEATIQGWTVCGRHSPETALAFCPEHSSLAPTDPSPVPPVVPDREASEDFYGHGGASEHRTCGTRAFCYGCSLSCYPSTEPGLPCPCCQNALDARASGSGVVPDKPALDPRICWFCLDPLDEPSVGGRCNAAGHPVVPAVTDDEAATLALAAAYNGKFVYGSPSSVVAALRSAGFLLVRDHTKET